MLNSNQPLLNLVFIPNLDDYFQTRVSGLDALKPGFRVQVLQIWRVQDKQTMQVACTSENCMTVHL